MKHLIIALLLSALLFAACSGKKEAARNSDASEAVLGDVDEDLVSAALFAIYAQKGTPEWNALDSLGVHTIATDFSTPGAGGAVRVQLLQDLSSFMLAAVTFNDEDEDFYPSYVFFDIPGKAGDVYEFDAIFTEGIPLGSITAVRSDNRGNGDPYTTYYLQESGFDGLPNGLVVYNEEFNSQEDEWEEPSAPPDQDAIYDELLDNQDAWFAGLKATSPFGSYDRNIFSGGDFYLGVGITLDIDGDGIFELWFIATNQDRSEQYTFLYTLVEGKPLCLLSELTLTYEDLSDNLLGFIDVVYDYDTLTQRIVFVRGNIRGFPGWSRRDVYYRYSRGKLDKIADLLSLNGSRNELEAAEFLTGPEFYTGNGDDDITVFFINGKAATADDYTLIVDSYVGSVLSRYYAN
ncbi:hypothetical protein [Leadbettera azotonutricia]|uniref:Putative lipoprotein n=1 Tax=Leadbettera azotonutricia (strain ATCC BAA-888 / DSM 13862 / ZAS-9) TaxID=545695 RepID=F5Y8K6_LEAAZ|nr:hypothetical protein [Leadbettera azotonutricia]AEF80675.1 putative lipoprotein [Leadbettera azotonutricia ZAS-9]